MRVTIEREECIACGACQAECPEVFGEDDDGISQIVDEYQVDGDPAVGEIPDDLEECAQFAADACPVFIIEVGE